MTFPSSPSGESEMRGGNRARRSPAPAPPPAARGRPAQRRGAGPAGPGVAPPWRPARRAALLGARNTSGFCGCCGDTAQCAGWERNAPLPQQKRWWGILSANCTPPTRPPPGPGGGKRPREFQPEALVESTTAASHRTETPFNRADAKRHSAGCEALASAAKCVFLWTSAQGKTAGRLTFSIRYKAQCQ